MAPSHRLMRVRRVMYGRGRLIERQDDIRAKSFLDLDRYFGSKTLARPVDVRRERWAIFVHTHEFGALSTRVSCGQRVVVVLEAEAQRKYLGATTVGHDRAVPGHAA